jgi:hypothetical protein
MKQKYSTIIDELNNETFYLKDGREIDPAEECEREAEDEG